jgi:very-short-patch-repair endonuclease
MWRESHDSQGFLATCGDPAVAPLAERQHGVVSITQLRAAGLGEGAIEHRVRRGRLHRIHRGVYAVGHARLTWRGRCWAAKLACGGPDAAALRHLTAAAAWDLAPALAGPIHVVSFGASRSMPGVRVQRSTRAETTWHDGLHVTTPTQTLLDLATALSPDRLERLCHRAEILRLPVDPPPGAKGARRLRAALPQGDPELTRSELEDRFLALVARAGLPRPLVNQRVLGHEVDFLWPDRRLIVETDGAATHLTASAFQEDRTRDAHLQAAGYRVVRFTWRDVTARPSWVARVLDSMWHGAPLRPAQGPP